MLTFVVLLILAVNSYSSQTLYVQIAAGSELQLDDVEESIASFENVISVKSFVTTSDRSEHPLTLWRKVEISDGVDSRSTIQVLTASSSIDYAEISPERHTCGMGLDGLTDDPLSEYQYHLDIINAYAAWDIAPDASEVVVAVIDNGFDMDHPDLIDAYWVNSAEDNGSTGVDDDQNGYVDDTTGWNFYENNNNPDAPVGVYADYHGTHCAGLIGATQDNGIGIAGVAPGCRVMTLRSGEGRIVINPVEAMIYAIDNGADVVSMSFTGSNISVLEKAVVDYAVSRDVIMVAAAGNSGSGSFPGYPASYEGVISVAWSDPDDVFASLSNHGVWVNIVAPGSMIYSTMINNSSSGGYGFASGTSMSTPIVAGVVAMLKAQNPEISYNQALARISQGSLPMERNVNHTNDSYCGRIDAWRTLVSDRPTILFKRLSYMEPDGDYIIEPGEWADVLIDLELIGQNAEQVDLTLLSLDQDVVVTQATRHFDGLSVGEFTAGILEVEVGQNASRGAHKLALAINADSWIDTIKFNLPVDPHWRNHKAGEMTVSVTDVGSIGNWDYNINSDDVADGVRLEGEAAGFLYHGSVIILSDFGVFDAVNYNNQPYDFETTEDGNIREGEYQSGRTTYTAKYISKQGEQGVVEIKQNSTSYPNGSNFVIFDFDVTNRLYATMSHWIGVFCDWDIFPLQTNTVKYEEDLRLSYMVGASGACGIVSLDDWSISGVTAIDNGEFMQNGFSDEEKWDLMLGNEAPQTAEVPKDYSHMIAVELGSIATDSTKNAKFAIVAGKTEEEMLQAANDVWGEVGREIPSNNMTLVPEELVITSAYPNPFNSSINITIATPEKTNLSLKIYDILGREVIEIYSDLPKAGGATSRFIWNGKNSSGIDVASGVYFVRAKQGTASSISKVLLSK
jgi:serine protease